MHPLRLYGCCPHLTSPLRFERRTTARSQCRRAFRASLDDGGGYIVPPIDLNPRTGTVCSACINSIVVQVKSSILSHGISIRAHPYLHVPQAASVGAFSFSGIALQLPRACYPNIRSVNHTVILTMAYAPPHPVSLNVSPSIFSAAHWPILDPVPVRTSIFLRLYLLREQPSSYAC